MKSIFASTALMTICLSGAFAKDEPVQEASAIIHRAPDSPASLYRQGIFSMGPAWQGLRKLEDSAVFVHRDTRKADKDMAYLWIDREFVHAGFYEKEKPYLSMRVRVIVDCGGMRSGVIESAYYHRRFGEGEPFARILQKPDMTDILPDSMEEQMHRIACAPKPAAKVARKATPHAPDAPPKDAAGSQREQAAPSVPKT